jgi:hypothetical protein
MNISLQIGPKFGAGLEQPGCPFKFVLDKCGSTMQNDMVEKEREAQNSVYFCLRLANSLRDNRICVFSR